MLRPQLARVVIPHRQLSEKHIKEELEEVPAIQAFARKLELDEPFLFVPKKEEAEATSEPEDSQTKKRQ